MTDTLLTSAAVLEARLAAARTREREARATQARLKREMASLDRRRETQVLCTLGRAWLALGERSASFRESGGRFLAGYVTRATDRDALEGTAWALPPPPPASGEAGDIAVGDVALGGERARE